MVRLRLSGIRGSYLGYICGSHFLSGQITEGSMYGIKYSLHRSPCLEIINTETLPIMLEFNVSQSVRHLHLLDMCPTVPLRFCLCKSCT
jgi:hypothetical protein